MFLDHHSRRKQLCSKIKYLSEINPIKVKEFLLNGDISVLEELEVARISMAMWKESNDGDYINIQSKKHLGEIVFKYMGIKPKVAGANTKSGRDKFDMSMVEELSKTYPWAENLRIYNKLLKIKRLKDENENILLIGWGSHKISNLEKLFFIKFKLMNILLSIT